MNDESQMAELLAEMREMRAELRRQTAQVATSPTVGKLVGLFTAARVGARSWVAMKGRLRPVVTAFGNREAMSLTLGEIAIYRAERKRTPYNDKGRTYTDLTINFECQILKTVLIWSVAEKLIPYNPLAGLRSVKTKKTRKTSPTEDEIGLLLARADAYMRTFILFAADSGLRRNEILHMRWDWIDEPNKVINLPAVATKSQKDRTAPITERTFAALRAMPRHLRSPFPFCNFDTEAPYSHVTVDVWFKDIVKASGVRAAPGDGSVRIHDLRHAYARRAARAGVRVEIISLILGHASIQQTLVYIQTGEDDLIEALDTFEKEVSRKPPKASTVGDGRIFISEKKST